ncbi:helix-turn-helix domain-containing protein [Dyadobacter sp. BHUBP1]|uniref:helix-turn-helix domain-containing protein n=1 Tax=Dyadobacter sp. BHUBP1 TaxID=3424178 RepID=UPI003D35753A
MTDFGSNFRKLREWAGLSQEALGISLNVSASVVNRIENNKRKLDIQILQKLAISLQLDISLVVMVLFKGKSALPKQKALKPGKALPIHA